MKLIYVVKTKNPGITWVFKRFHMKHVNVFISITYAVFELTLTEQLLQQAQQRLQHNQNQHLD